MINLLNKHTNKQDIIDEIKKFYDIIVKENNIDNIKKENLELIERNKSLTSDLSKLNKKLKQVLKENKELKENLKEKNEKMKNLDQFLKHFQGELSGLILNPEKEKDREREKDLQIEKEVENEKNTNENQRSILTVINF